MGVIAPPEYQSTDSWPMPGSTVGKTAPVMIKVDILDKWTEIRSSLTLISARRSCFPSEGRR